MKMQYTKYDIEYWQCRTTELGERSSEQKVVIDRLVLVLENALSSLAIMKLPQLDDTVATNDEILDMLAASFKDALVEAKK